MWHIGMKMSAVCAVKYMKAVAEPLQQSKVPGQGMEKKRKFASSELEAGSCSEQKSSKSIQDGNRKRVKVDRPSSSETDSSLDSDSESSISSSTKRNTTQLKKRSKKKKEDRKRKNAKKDKKKKSKKKHKKHKSGHTKNDLVTEAKPVVGPAPVMSKDLLKAAKKLSVASSTDAGRRLIAPMTKAEWEKQQSVIRRVHDPTTGRDRLIKGDGEILEEIVTKERHKQINKQSTYMDGVFYESQLYN